MYPSEFVHTQTHQNSYFVSTGEIHNLFIQVLVEISKLEYPLALGEFTCQKKDFDKLLFEAIDEGLSSMGESSKQAIYSHLKKGFNVKKHEIPYRIEDFAREIERIFGLGANFLEILIMKNLYEKVGRTIHLLEPKDFVFTEYVAATKRSFIGKEKAEELV